jgi:hypothetical protein
MVTNRTDAKAIVPVPANSGYRESPEPSPLALLEKAISSGMDPDKLGKLMDLAERWRAGQAAEKFAEAIARFQAECPTVQKTRSSGGDGKFAYKFADLSDVMRVAAPILARHGIMVSFGTKPANNGRAVEVTCRVRVGTHVEETVIEVPIPDMRVSDAQKYGAAISYAKRYGVCAALNIVVADEDNDAASLDTIGEKEIAQIESLLVSKKRDRKKFLDWAGVDEIGDILTVEFPKIIDTLKRIKV